MQMSHFIPTKTDLPSINCISLCSPLLKALPPPPPRFTPAITPSLLLSSLKLSWLLSCCRLSSSSVCMVFCLEVVNYIQDQMQADSMIQYQDMMLKEVLKDKTIAIISFQSLTAKILLKKLFSLTNQPIISIHLTKKTGKSHDKVQRMLKDPFFTGEQQIQMKNQVQFVDLDHLGQHIADTPNQQIDILFSLFEPVDFSNQERVINHHLLTTGRIVAALSRIHIAKCLLLSSVYIKSPGYIGEETEMDEELMPHRFQSKGEAQLYLKNHFQGVIESWRWTIEYMEKSYLSISRQTVIVRVPSLGPTYAKNEGYISELTSLTYLICQVGLGNITSLDGLKNNKIDVVPTDFASHLLLVLAAKELSARAEVVNLSTTTRNYITLQQFVDISRQAWHEYGEKPAKIQIIQTKLGQRLKHGAEKLPSSMKKRLGSMLDVVSWKIDGQRQTQQQSQRQSIINKYKYFFCHEWLCESIKTIDIFNQLTLEDQQLYNFNVNSINWKVYVKLCVYSMKKYILNQKVEQFKPEAMDLLVMTNKKQTYFSDIMWAMQSGKDAKGQTQVQAIQFVLNSKAVKEAVHSLVEENMLKLQNPPASYEKAEEELNKVAEEICTQMFSDYSMKSIRLFGWFLHKLFSNIYQKVVIDKTALGRIQNHDESKGPLIIIPTHRSYIDFLIISYVFFGYNIKVPHVAAAEDFLGMVGVHVLLRQSGAFFIKRNQKKYKDLYKAILNEYLSKLMIGNHFIEFFIEGTRSRTGKMMAPKFGILSVVAKNVAEGRIPDAFILPVTINYEKILEGMTFTYEMMGEAKVKESLSRVLKAVDVLKENYGRIHLEFCSPISVKEWLGGCPGSFPQKMENLGIKIVRELTNNLVISGSAIVSSVILMNRKGISDDQLQQQTTWLSKQISSRGIKITRSQPDSSISINSTLSLLQGIVVKSKKDMFQMQVNFDQNSFVKMFTLTYYRNTLTHIFFEEAVIATALASFEYTPITEQGINIEILFSRTVFLWTLLEKEFNMEYSLNDRQRFNKILNFMSQQGVVKLEEDDTLIKATNLTSNYYNFYWSLIWPVVESYWVTCLYLFKLESTSEPMALTKLISQIQWFEQSLINDRICSFLQAISSDTIKNAINALLRMKMIVSVKVQDVACIKLGVNQTTLRGILEQIGLYLKTSYTKSLKGILSTKNPSVYHDFPFLSKL